MTEWQIIKLGDIAYESSDRVDNPSTSGYDRFVGLDHFVSGDFKISKWGTTNDLISAMKLFKAGDTLFARRNAYLKRASMVDFDGICSGDAIVLRNNEKVIDGFLPLILNTNHFWEHAIANAAGSMSKRVRVEDLMKYEFPIPPLDEQRRIADLLWAADDSITKQDELISQALITKKSFIDKIFANNELKEIGDYAESVTSGSRWWAKHYSDSGDIFIRVANLTRETAKIDLSDLQYVTPPEGAEMERTKLQTGDLLISVTADLGRIGVVSAGFPQAFMSQHVAQVRLKQDKVIPEYVAYSLLSSNGQKQFHKLNDAGAKAGMNLQNVKRLKFSWQTLEQQAKAMEMFKSFEETIELARQHLDNQKQLKKQVLNTALSKS